MFFRVHKGPWDQVWGCREAPGRHRGGTREAPRRHQGGTKEAPRRQLAIHGGPKAAHIKRSGAYLSQLGAYLGELSMIRSQPGARCVQPGTFCDQLNPTRDPFESSLGNNFEPLALLVHTTLVPRPSHPFQAPFSLFPFNLPPFSHIPLPYFLARRNARSD